MPKVVLSLTCVTSAEDTTGAPEGGVGVGVAVPDAAVAVLVGLGGIGVFVGVVGRGVRVALGGIGVFVLVAVGGAGVLVGPVGVRVTVGICVRPGGSVIPPLLLQ
jgi:hypothetical protein